MASYPPYEPLQQMLLPAALQDWLPEGHLAYFVSDAVDGLDLSAFHARYALLNRAKSADEAEKNEPELDIPAEIARRQDRLNAIAEARTRLEQRQREADLARGAAARMTIASPRARMASPRQVATSATSAFPMMRLRRTSPIPTAAS